MFDDEIEKISKFDIVTGKTIKSQNVISIFPATHFVLNENKRNLALQRIEDELVNQIEYFKNKGQLLEAERINQRTRYDLEMLKELIEEMKNEKIEELKGRTKDKNTI